MVTSSISCTSRGGLTAGCNDLSTALCDLGDEFSIEVLIVFDYFSKWSAFYGGVVYVGVLGG